MRKTEAVLAKNHIIRQTISFYLTQTGSDSNTVGMAEPIIFKNTPIDQVGENQLLPTFELYPMECQSVMDQLWQLGFRPSEGTGSAGAMAATQAHLKDLQKMLDMVLPRALR